MTHAEREAGQTRAEPGAACPGPSRFWAAALGGDPWSSDERRHIADCPRCRRAEQQVRVAAGAAGPAATTFTDEAHGPPSSDPDMSRPPGPAATTTDMTLSPDTSGTAEGLATAATECGLPSIPRSLGDYEVIRTIGRGGMGVVYLALDQ